MLPVSYMERKSYPNPICKNKYGVLKWCGWEGREDTANRTGKGLCQRTQTFHECVYIMSDRCGIIYMATDKMAAGKVHTVTNKWQHKLLWQLTNCRTICLHTVCSSAVCLTLKAHIWNLAIKKKKNPNNTQNDGFGPLDMLEQKIKMPLMHVCTTVKIKFTEKTFINHASRT
jgi:hypothetical protein